MDVISDQQLAAERRHLPAAGRRAGDAVHPQAARSCWHKAVAIVTAGATLARRHRTRSSQFDYGQAAKLQFFVDTEWIEVIKANYTIGLDGISLPLYFLSMVDHVARDRSTRGTTCPTPGNPKAFFILMLVLQTGMAGTFIAQDLILFFVFFEVVLLPMYFMIGVWGGEQPPVRLAEVLPLHDVRLGADAGVVPRAVLSKTGAAELQLRSHPRSRTAPGIDKNIAGLDLRRHVHRLRRQGADVPVPHLAARRPYRGAHAGLGHPGRDPAEARHVRLRAHRHPDPAAGCGRVGAVRSASSP